MNIFNEIKSHKYRTWKTVTMSLMFVALGLVSSSFGPTILDLQLMVRTTIEQITLIIPMKAAGNMFGAVICGILLPYTDHQTVLPLSVFALTVFFVITSFCTTLTELLVAMAALGISSGFVVNAGNVWIIHLWGKVNEPFMQIAHFSFGIGAFIGPIICEPYLVTEERLYELKWKMTLNEDESNATLLSNMTEIEISNDIDAETTTPYSLNSVSNITELFPMESYYNVMIQPDVPPEELHIRDAYFIIAIINVFIIVIFCITCFYKRSNKPHPTRQQNVEVKTSQPSTSNDISSVPSVNLVESDSQPKTRVITFKQKFIMILIVSLLSHLTYAVELTFGQLLSTYAVKSELHLDKSTGSFMTSFYWGCFTFFRLITIILVNFMCSRTALIMDLFLVMSGLTILLLFSSIYEWALWIGSGLIGVGISSVYPSILGYLESIMPVTPRIASITTVFACIGEFIVPMLIGYYIDDYPMIFVHVNFIYGVLACVMMGLAILWEFHIRRYLSTPMIETNKS